MRIGDRNTAAITEWLKKSESRCWLKIPAGTGVEQWSWIQKRVSFWCGLLLVAKDAYRILTPD